MKEDAGVILAAARRGAELARNLLTLARTAPSWHEPVDVHQAINEVHDIVSRTFDRRIAMRVNLDASRPVVTGDRSLLTNAFLNLALNARDAMPEGGQLTITDLRTNARRGRLRAARRRRRTGPVPHCAR